MGKICFPLEKWHFELIGNSLHTAVVLAIGKARNIYNDCLMFYPNSQNVKWKHFKYKFTLNNNFMMKFGHLLICWWVVILFAKVNCGNSEKVINKSRTCSFEILYLFSLQNVKHFGKKHMWMLSVFLLHVSLRYYF